MFNKLRCVTAAALLALPVSAEAAITISSVTPSSTFFTYNPINLINGSGLSGNLHDGTFTNKWMSDMEVLPTLTFDLGSVFALSNTVIWNYGGGCCGSERNVNSFMISLSTNGSTYTPFGTFALTNSTTDPFGADTINLSGSARYVKFNILSNQGSPQFSGLSEVQFNGLAAAVPEPATWMMMLIGMAGVGYSMRRKDKQTLRVSFS